MVTFMDLLHSTKINSDVEYQMYWRPTKSGKFKV